MRLIVLKSAANPNLRPSAPLRAPPRLSAPLRAPPRPSEHLHRLCSRRASISGGAAGRPRGEGVKMSEYRTATTLPLRRLFSAPLSERLSLACLRSPF